MELSDAAPPRHSVIESQFGNEYSIVTVMCNGTKFVIEAEAKDLKDTDFAEEYRQLVEPLQYDDNDDDECYEAMCDWMIQPCFPIFRDCAPPVLEGQEFTIHDFYYPRTLQLRLLISNQCLIARRFAGRHRKLQTNLTIQSTLLPSFPEVPRIKASAIKIVLDRKRNDDLCDVPRRVRTTEGTDCYFKPVFDQSQHVREVRTLTSIAQADLGHLRISRLVGIVISDNARETIGLVVEWISSIGDLQSVEAKDHKAEHTRWRRQVTSIVDELHKSGIIWGDVHPGNILIDVHLDAWVIDFGGGWVEPFVPRKLRDTISGDLHGIRKVFEYLEDHDSCQLIELP